jgi:Ca2+/Na+ antiporter
MLRFFFHRYSPMVRLMELIGFAGIVFVSWQFFAGRLSILESIFLILILIGYLFLRFCTMRRWYKAVSRSHGIGLQFEKAMVPSGYILAVMMWLFVILKSPAILAIVAFLLAVIAHVNIILLALHFKDRDKTPVNSFSMTH